MRLTAVFALVSALSLSACGDDTATEPVDTGVPDADVVEEDAEPEPDAPVGLPPVIDSIAPSTSPLEGGRQAGINGANFESPTAVFFGSVEVTSDIISDRLLSVVIPEGESDGIVDITVETPHGSATLEDAFTYLPTTLPRASAIEPTVGDIAGGDVVTVTGVNFPEDGAESVIFGTVASREITGGDETTFTVIAPPAGYGTVDITINFDNDNIQVLEQAFSYTADLELTGIVPGSGSASGGTAILLNGAGLTEGVDLEIYFGDELAPTSRYIYEGDTLSLETPPGEVGVVDVRATGDNGESTLEDAFEYE